MNCNTDIKSKSILFNREVNSDISTNPSTSNIFPSLGRKYATTVYHHHLIPVGPCWHRSDNLPGATPGSAICFGGISTPGCPSSSQLLYRMYWVLFTWYQLQHQYWCGTITNTSYITHHPCFLHGTVVFYGTPEPMLVTWHRH